MRARRFIPILLASALAFVGCGDDSRPAGDGGVGDAEADTGPSPDADAPDTDQPRVLSTTPEDEADGVAVDTPLEIEFSEPMRQDAGTIRIQPGNVTVRAADADFDAEGRTLTWEPPDGWPSSRTVTVTVEDDFVDLAGNPLLFPFTFAFETPDERAPFVVASTPAEGAAEVSPDVGELTIVFSETMDATAGELALSGGAGTIGTIDWAGDRFTVPISGLEGETAYSVELSGFTDVAGNALDGEPELGDGALDFTTGVDVSAPAVVSSMPAEGATGVPVDTSTIRIELDEPMDTSAGEAVLDDGSSTTTLTPSWTDGDTAFELDVAGLLGGLGVEHSVSLEGFVDLAGNALDPVPYLGDGKLDFVTGADASAPVVTGSDPAEGATGVPYETELVSVTFSETMRTEIATAPMSDGTSTTTLPGIWNAGGTEITFDVAGLLRSGRAYRIDLRGFEDATRNPLDPTGSYLGDGVLDLRTVDATGENCRDVLTEAHATVAGGVTTWDLSAFPIENAEGGGETCDSSPGQDAVMRYRKSSGDSTDGAAGRLLRVTAEAGGTYDDVTVEVRRDVCTLGDSFDALEVCSPEESPNEVVLDVPAGDYYITVTDESSYGDFPATVVTVEEIPVEGNLAEGESCSRPFTTSSDLYTAPSFAGGPHTWDIPAEAVSRFDRGPVEEGPGSITCGDGSGDSGDDAVIRFDKAADDSVLLVDVTATGGSYDDVDVEVLTGACDPREATAAAQRCREGLQQATFTVDAPAGPVWIWVAGEDGGDALEGARVQVTELTTLREGESCATARTLSTGTSSPDRTSVRRLDAPGCFPTDADVAWYEITLTEDILGLQTGESAALALVDPETLLPISCAPDGSTLPVGRKLEAGTRVCVALEAGSSAIPVTVTESPYDGVGSSFTPLSIDRPLYSSGSPRSITSDNWLAVTPTTLYMQFGSSNIMEAPLSGGPSVVHSSDDDVTTSTVGEDGLAVGEQLFSLDDDDTVTGPRLFQLWDGRTAPWVALPWDDVPAGVEPYQPEDAVSLTWDGGRFLFATQTGFDSDITHVYAVSDAGPSLPIDLGAVDAMEDVVAIAADDEYLYLGATVDGTEGIFRIAHSAMGSGPATAEPLALGVDLGSSYSTTPMVLDNLVDPRFLYFRADSGEVHAVLEPDADALWIGPVITLGTGSDQAMTWANEALYLFETETDEDGRFVRVE